ncbi:hypothetical protein ONE63_008118 [Megalurothrips usitatus]|uniref:BED-type domain-containing protein n=1 Tax=Megalurothrips usitatus TaxID=439358 RepID=A0AAV7XRR3_9NEOP|nr:hypothetical protein ONE63_008118 [Megalurothrips usitatus]
MPPQKGPVWSHFSIIRDDQGIPTEFKCKFCNKTYKKPNGTRMQTHLSDNCANCPAEIKMKISHKVEEEDDETEDNPVIILPQSPHGNSASPSNVVVCSSKQPAAKKQKKIEGYVDTLTLEEKKTCDRPFARALFVKGLPFDTFEGEDMQAAFRSLRPSYKPPTPKSIGGSLLNSECERVQSKCSALILKSSSVTLLSDGWTNQRGEGLVNFVVATPEPIFLDSVEPGTQRENSDFMFEKFDFYIDKVGSEKVNLIVTDNASVMRATWKKIREKYPHIHTIGCGAHGLNLMFKDVLKTNPFVLLVQRAKKVVKIKKRRQLYAIFKSKQIAKYGNKKRALIMPSPTRFSGAYFMFVSLYKNKQALQETMLAEEVDIPEDLRTIVLDNSGFWELLTFAIDYLQPIADGTHLIVGDSARLSQMVAICINIKQKMKSAENMESDIPLAELFKINKAVDSRINKFCINDIHRATYLIDPQFQGAGFRDTEVMAGIKIVKGMATHLGLDVDSVVENLADFRTKSRFYSNDLIWESARKLNPVKWWGTFCQKQPLFPIADRLLKCPLQPHANGYGRIMTSSRIRDEIASAWRNAKRQSALRATPNLHLILDWEEGLKGSEVNVKRKFFNMNQFLSLMKVRMTGILILMTPSLTLSTVQMKCRLPLTTNTASFRQTIIKIRNLILCLPRTC